MERMFLKDLVDSNGDRIVHYTKCKDENKYVSVFIFSFCRHMQYKVRLWKSSVLSHRNPELHR